MAPYAKAEVFWITLLGTAATATVAWWCGWWALLPALLAGGLLSFYRDPPRSPPTGADLLLSPADGRITDIGPSGEGSQRSLRIVIFLSVANVHVNRSPCAGRVAEVTYKAGKFLNALKPESTTENENNLLKIDPRAPLPGPVLVKQIAGVLARRIVCAVRPGDELTAGQRFGMIKLGSRTEVSVPDDGGWQVQVKVGEAVKGGLTILARRAKTPG